MPNSKPSTRLLMGTGEQDAPWFLRSYEPGVRHRISRCRYHRGCSPLRRVISQHWTNTGRATLNPSLCALSTVLETELLFSHNGTWNKMFYKGRLSEKKTILVSQISTVIIGVVAIAIAINPFDSVFWLAVFAWAGLATCFGPPVILSLYWKGVTRTGAIAGMIVGPVVTVLWYLWPPIDIYEGGPAFIAALLTIVVVSLLTKSPDDEQFNEMWSAYNEQNEAGTPSFLASDYHYLKNMRADELRLKSDRRIVRDLLEEKLTVASSFKPAKGSASFGSTTP